MHIYKVTTWGDGYDSAPRKTLGFAIGQPDDIGKFYEHKKTGEIYIEPIEVINITPEAANEKLSLWNSKQGYLKELSDIEEKLK